MNKYIFSLLSAVALIGFTSCDDTQEEPHIQWYPVVTVEGPSEYQLELGSSFTMPVYSAVNTMTGEDATSAVSVSIYDVIAGEYVDAVSTDSPGMFNIYYTSKASEVQPSSDYPVYKQVDVYVYDPTIETDISGSYNVNMDKTIYEYWDWTFAQCAEYYKDDNGDLTTCTITISQVLPGFFSVSDLLGGWYDQVRGYGESYPGYYNMTGYISLNSDNTITLLSSYITAWGDGLDGMWDGYYDEETQTITYEVWYADYLLGFYIDMTNANAE